MTNSPNVSVVNTFLLSSSPTYPPTYPILHLNITQRTQTQTPKYPDNSSFFTFYLNKIVLSLLIYLNFSLNLHQFY